MKKRKTIFYLLLALLLAGLALLLYQAALPVEYLSSATVPKFEKKITHIETPNEVKGIYMTACVASLPSLRGRLVNLIDESELNALVIDIKDYSGTVSIYQGLGGCRVPGMAKFIDELHSRGIYVIGRVTVFQDPLYSLSHPDLAVKRKDGSIWKDRKGLSFIDVGAREYWDYIIEISKQAEKLGFDEINYDYIRYPSDGNMNDIYFGHTGTTTKKEMLRQFFEYLDKELEDTKVRTSADLFGMVTNNNDDLGIGQVLENALPYFDYIAPMVYPSHYPPNFNGWPDPNKMPYEIVKFAMDGAVKKAENLASSTQSQKINKEQLRPWLQDNDYPVPYSAAMVRAQIQATYDAGLTSWMLWDPSNTYTKEALLYE